MQNRCPFALTPPIETTPWNSEYTEIPIFSLQSLEGHLAHDSRNVLRGPQGDALTQGHILTRGDLDTNEKCFLS